MKAEKVTEIGPDYIFEPPYELTFRQSKIWLRLEPTLHRAGLLTSQDVDVFYRLVCLLDEQERFQVYLNHNGEVYTRVTPKGIELRTIQPERILMDKLQKELKTLQDRFGMSPGARKKMGATHADEAEDPFEKHLGHKKRA